MILQTKGHDGMELTVILSTYNRGNDYLRFSIESVLKQTYQDFVFYIINNGSTDNTEDVIREYSDERIKYIKYDENKIVYHILEEWFLLAKTKYFIWVHDDDIFDEKLFEREIDVLDRHTDAGLVAPDVCEINENGDIIGPYFEEFSEDIIFKPYDFIKCGIKKYMKVFPLCPSIMYRTSIAQESLKEIDREFSPGVSIDTLLQYKINEKYQLIIFKELLFYYRVYKNQDSNNKLGLLKYDYEVTSEYFKNFISNEEYIRYKNRAWNLYKATDISSRWKSKMVSCVSDDVDDMIREAYTVPEVRKKSSTAHVHNMALRMKYLRYLFGNREVEYVFWGSGSASDKTKVLLDHFMPNMKLAGYIDGIKSGEKNGLKITKSSEYDFSSNHYIIIATTVAGYDVYKFLCGKGKIEMEDFMFCGSFA